MLRRGSEGCGPRCRASQREKARRGSFADGGGPVAVDGRCPLRAAQGASGPVHSLLRGDHRMTISFRDDRTAFTARCGHRELNRSEPSPL